MGIFYVEKYYIYEWSICLAFPNFYLQHLCVYYDYNQGLLDPLNREKVESLQYNKVVEREKLNSFITVSDWVPNNEAHRS